MKLRIIIILTILSLNNVAHASFLHDLFNPSPVKTKLLQLLKIEEMNRLRNM